MSEHRAPRGNSRGWFCRRVRRARIKSGSADLCPAEIFRSVVKHEKTFRLITRVDFLVEVVLFLSPLLACGRLLCKLSRAMCSCCASLLTGDAIFHIFACSGNRGRGRSARGRRARAGEARPQRARNVPEQPGCETCSTTLGLAAVHYVSCWFISARRPGGAMSRHEGFLVSDDLAVDRPHGPPGLGPIAVVRQEVGELRGRNRGASDLLKLLCSFPTHSLPTHFC